MTGFVFSGALASRLATDGYPLTYRVWPARAERRATLILLNGVMSHALWFEPIAGPLAAQGFHVVGADRRGSGENRDARGDAPDRAMLVGDVRSIVEKERAEDPVFLVGWCWGAVLAINVALETERDFAGLLLLAPGLYPTALLKARMAEELAQKAGAREDQAVLESPIPEELFTEGPALEGFIQGDPLRLRTFSPRFWAISAKLTQNAILRLRTLGLDQLLVLASDDRATDNTDTLRAFEKLPPGPRREVKMIASQHGLPLDAPEALTAAISDFVVARLRRRP